MQSASPGKKLWIIAVATSSIALSGCAAYQEGLFYPTQGEWKLGHQTGDQNQRIHEFVLPGENIDNWTQLLTLHIIRRTSASEPIDHFVRGIHAALSKQCPTIVWNVIQRQFPTETEADSLLYEWKVTNCPPEADQHEIARVIYGEFNIFRLAYAAKTKALSPETRNEWINALSQAKITVTR